MTQDGSQVDDQLFDIVERIEAGGTAEVRRDDDVPKLDEGVIGVTRLIVESVEPKSSQPARGKRLEQGVAVDLVGLRDVNQQSARFNDRKLSSADEVASLMGCVANVRLTQSDVASNSSKLQ